MTGSPSPGASRLVVVVLLDTGQDQPDPAHFPELDGALQGWAEGERATRRRNLARVAVICAGAPVTVLGDRQGAGDFLDLADLDPPRVSAGGAAAWGEALTHALRLADLEATAVGDGSPAAILLFLVHGDSWSSLTAPPTLPDLADRIRREERGRRLYVVAAGTGGPGLVGKTLAPESSFTVRDSGYAEAFHLLGSAVDLLTHADGRRPDPLSVYDRLKLVRDEFRRPGALTTSSRYPAEPRDRAGGDGPAGEPGAAAATVTAAVEPAPFELQRLPPIKYPRSGRQLARAFVPLLLAVATGMLTWLLATGRPVAAVAVSGVVLLLFLPLIWLPRR